MKQNTLQPTDGQIFISFIVVQYCLLVYTQVKLCQINSQPGLTIDMDIKTDVVICGIKLTYLSENKYDYGVNHIVQVLDEIQLK